MSRLSPGGRGRRLAGGGGWAAGALAAGLLLAPATAGAGWSQPAVLSHCPTAAQPRVVFPSADPHRSSGPGAVIWSGESAVCAAGRSGGSGLDAAPIGPDDVAGPAMALSLPPGPPVSFGGLAAAPATGDGRIVIAAGLAGDPSSPTAVLEGRTGARFGRPAALGARTAPLASATSYLGDIALATVSAREGRVELRLQRHGARGISRPLVLSRRGAATVSTVAVGLDYRGDAIVVWAQGGFIYRRVLRASSRLEPVERVAPSPPGPHLQALISDDNRGIVAWTSDIPVGGTTITRVYLDASDTGVHFGRPRLLEQFRNPPGLALPDGSLRLVRLASEGVMIAWTGMSGGRYVVRAASVSLFERRRSAVISGPAGDAVLADLATGPHNEGLALWTSAPRLAGGFDLRNERILSARGVVEPVGRAVFSAPEVVAGAGPIRAPRVAVDPASDNAVAAWESPGGGIAYATKRPGAALRRGGPVAHADAGRGGWPAYAWGLLALVGLGSAAGLAALAGRHRAHRARRARSSRRTLRLERAPHDG